MRKSEAALLFNNLSDNLCGHSKIRILNVARRKTVELHDKVIGHYLNIKHYQ
ncbi:IS1 family transposase [Escherichia coli]|uniref:IS1 family transposase n=1 Tax=Escherichia coli TaxID=562 RepID=UPI0037580F76